MRPAAVGLALATAAAVVGCGGSGHATRSGTSGAVTATSSRPASTTQTGSRPSGPGPGRRRAVRARAPAGPPIGRTQAVSTDGSHLTVTVSRVIDPLSDTGSPSLPGTRQVGVELRIADQAGATYDSTASGDVSLVVSPGQASPLDARSGICQTPDTDFESLIGSGDVRAGCVAFSGPRRARVLAVRFAPHSRAPGRVAWRVP